MVRGSPPVLTSINRSKKEHPLDRNGDRLYRERSKRISDVIELRLPDRVPISVGFNFFPAKYAGFPAKDLMYDPEKSRDAYWRVIRDFQPDTVQGPYDR